MIRTLTKKPQAICFVVLLCACSSRAPQTTRAGGPEIFDPQAIADAAPVDAAQGISEAEARDLLDRLFRDAGLRVVSDVSWLRQGIEVTLDGYDPERDLGYEYMSEAEAGTELGPNELRILQENRQILLLVPGPRAELAARAQAFLQAHSLADAGPGGTR